MKTSLRPILHVEASPYNHPAEVSEPMFPTHNEERFVKIWMVFSQFLLLDFSVHQKDRDRTFGHKADVSILCCRYVVSEHLFISACSFFS